MRPTITMKDSIHRVGSIDVLYANFSSHRFSMNSENGKARREATAILIAYSL